MTKEFFPLVFSVAAITTRECCDIAVHKNGFSSLNLFLLSSSDFAWSHYVNSFGVAFRTPENSLSITVQILESYAYLLLSSLLAFTLFVKNKVEIVSSS